MWRCSELPQAARPADGVAGGSEPRPTDKAIESSRCGGVQAHCGGAETVDRYLPRLRGSTNLEAATSTPCSVQIGKLSGPSRCRLTLTPSGRIQAECLGTPM